MLYPMFTETRQVIDLSGIWNFKLDIGEKLNEELALKPIRNSESYQIAVSSSYNDLFEVDKIRNHVGWVWYEKDLNISEKLLNERLVLRFGSVIYEAKVFFNYHS
ncbi:hypothetical protein IL099_002338 [Enterococcus hirae]|nr:hypothetical protein [Enterococcus hirae]